MPNKKTNYIIGISIGDPGGIGPEIVLKSSSFLTNYKNSIPVIIGDKKVIEKNCKTLKIFPSINFIKNWQDVKKYHLNIFSPNIIKKNYPIGENSKICGYASFIYVKKAVEFWKEKKIDALVTLPISKKAWYMAGEKYSGHTELLGALLGQKQTVMIMIAKNIRTLLVTTHIPLNQVSKTLTSELIIKKTIVGYNFLLDFGIKKPVIGISSFNPHAGEEGILGEEEKKIILPAISYLNKKGINCIGPIPADIIFKKALKNEIDMIVNMYHDQALIPLKTFYFEKLINFTAGIPMIRTSPGHGTGFDIAYKNKANPSSFIEAYKFALKMLKNNKFSGKPGS